MYWIVGTAFKPNSEIYGQATLLPTTLTTVHFGEVVNQTRFGTYFRNSAVVSILTTVIAMAIGVLAAYPLTRLTFTGRTLVARSVIVTYLVPGSLLFIPVFQIAYQLGLTDRALGLVIVYLIDTVPFCTWLAISYFNTIPGELEDAALVDGATRLQSLLFIILPLALPALAVIALFAFTNSWNEFLFALLLIGRDSEKTIPPVLIYLLAQRWVVSGLASGGVKH
jgi:ABC-type glycerol-3-phosphate transport system permease component